MWKVALIQRSLDYIHKEAKSWASICCSFCPISHFVQMLGEEGRILATGFSQKLQMIELGKPV